MILLIGEEYNNMNRKKVMWVCCDIQGTYTSSDLHADQRRLEILIKMDDIRKQLELDYVVFSFLSTMECRYILDYYETNKTSRGINELIKTTNKISDTKIICGPQMGCDGSLYNGKEVKNICNSYVSKAEQLITQKRKLEETDLDINKIIYIDDQPNVNAQIALSNKNIINSICNNDLEFIIIHNNSGPLYLTDQAILYANIYECKNKNGLDFVIEGLDKLETDISKKKGVSYEKSSRIYCRSKCNNNRGSIL